MRIRLATLKDAKALWPLISAFYAEEQITKHRALKKALKQVLSDARVGHVLVATEEKALVGYVVLGYGFSLEQGGKDAFIDELFVMPSHRERGLGRTLVKRALRVAKQNKVGTVNLEVSGAGVKKKRWYASLGFAQRPYPLMSTLLTD